MLILQAFLQTAGQITFNCKLIFKNGFRLVPDPPDMPPIKHLPTSGKSPTNAPPILLFQGNPYRSYSCPYMKSISILQDSILNLPNI
ncbi:MAG: hypothetical protein HWD63_05840 [Candidatus Parvibacillus calidus]|nr:MAG: hypothetical protein HWD63_05840 [Candidatus Parvibacillus calidus]